MPLSNGLDLAPLVIPAGRRRPETDLQTSRPTMATNGSTSSTVGCDRSSPNTTWRSSRARQRSSTRAHRTGSAPRTTRRSSSSALSGRRGSGRTSGRAPGVAPHDRRAVAVSASPDMLWQSLRPSQRERRRSSVPQPSRPGDDAAARWWSWTRPFPEEGHQVRGAPRWSTRRCPQAGSPVPPTTCDGFRTALWGTSSLPAFGAVADAGSVYKYTCQHRVPEPVVLRSPLGRRWCVVRCGLCGQRL